MSDTREPSSARSMLSDLLFFGVVIACLVSAQKCSERDHAVTMARLERGCD